MHSLKDLLDRKVKEFNRPGFVAADPVSIPHLFSKKQDIEISALFAAVFAWGNRVTIIRKSKELMEMMELAPHEFCLHAGPAELKRVMDFSHRTFNSTDLLYFIEFFRWHYQNHESLEAAFAQWVSTSDLNIENALNGFHHYFFSLPMVPHRTKKHIASPASGSTCKRINMFLRWMVRRDRNGVDFGIWKKIKPAQLVCPIDLHVARVSRKLGLLKRKQTDWKAALELTETLKQFDPLDPVKYDFALFGLGITENFRS